MEVDLLMFLFIQIACNFCERLESKQDFPSSGQQCPHLINQVVWSIIQLSLAYLNYKVLQCNVYSLGFLHANLYDEVCETLDREDLELGPLSGREAVELPTADVPFDGVEGVALQVVQTAQ